MAHRPPLLHTPGLDRSLRTLDSVETTEIAYFDPASGDVAELDTLIATTTTLATYPHAVAVDRGVVVYDGATIGRDRVAVMAEMCSVLRDGPGVFVVTGAVERDVVASVTDEFEQIIAEEGAAGIGAGDHFAVAGTNIRVWNALEKLAVRQPGLFVDYYSNGALALASNAWLGAGYQVTAQVNVVNPGGAAQNPHRDYHLGFMSGEQAARFPRHVHAMSPMLTLQGAIAHCDMPVASGPTKVLPHSQKFEAGYVAASRADVAERFEASFVQLPLQAGDAMFFNPALLHAAGCNTTAGVRRMANLLQVSSAFGRAMENVDRTRVTLAVFDALAERLAGGWSSERLEAAIAVSAEGYAFPTNLDRDPPVGGLAPASQADLVRRALGECWSRSALAEALSALDERRRTN